MRYKRKIPKWVQWFREIWQKHVLLIVEFTNEMQQNNTKVISTYGVYIYQDTVKEYEKSEKR